MFKEINFNLTDKIKYKLSFRDETYIFKTYMFDTYDDMIKKIYQLIKKVDVYLFYCSLKKGKIIF